ncbi:MAG: ABC transporter permease, partial [Opitutae bacterium]|nr:ABC transporter permease [Opitutae bacterium]
MKLLHQLRSLLRKDKLDAEMAEEMRLHLEMQAERNRAAGMSADDAHYAARRQFGNVASLQEQAREQRGWVWLDQLRQDAQYAGRQIAKSPGFAAVVVLTLAFGIAVNAALFGIVNVFFLQPSALPGAERLVLLMHRTDMMKMPLGLSYPDYRDYRDRLKNVEGLIAFLPTPAHLSADGTAPQRTWVEVVSPNAFVDSGVPAALGRVLVPADGEAKGGAPVAMLAYAHWKNHFGADPGILGRAVRLNGKPFTVVGVAPERMHGFHSMIAASAFVPVGAIDTLRPGMADSIEWRGAPMWRVMGRLKPGVSLATARAEAVVLLEQLTREFPDTHRNYRAFVIPENRARPDPSVAEYLPVFAALFVGLVALVLASACANVANLMIARAATRQHELTVRAALGAGRGRLIRQLLVESLLLAAIAGLVGWLLADAAGWAMHTFAPPGDPPVATDFAPGWRSYLFTAVISLVAGLASGLLPALRASRVDLVSQLKRGIDEAMAVGRHRLRDMLVIGQVAMSLIVLICAGLFLQSLRRVQSVDLGFRPERLLMLSYDLSLQGYDDNRSRNFNDDLLARVRAIPGVESAGLTSHVPFDKQINAREVRPENPPPQLKDGIAQAKIAMASPGFAETLGVRLRQGRGLRTTDQANTPRVAVINAALANVCWPDQDAVGKRFQPWKDGPWIEVVGVTETAKYMMLSEPSTPSFLMSLTQETTAPVTLLVRTSGEPAAMASRLRAEVQALDPQLPLYDVQTMGELMGSSVFAELPLRMGMGIALVQGGISLVLAIMGLYAVVAFGVAQRTREIGIRMALGADADRVVSLVVREGMRLSVIGAVAGLLFSILLGLGLSKVLFGLGAIEPVTFGVVSVLMLGTTALACWLPARRAARVDPLVTLRAE